MRKPAITLDHVLDIPYFSAQAWAPDGRHLGFVRDDGGRFSLCEVDVQTGQETQISEGSGRVGVFSWAKDGRLAYVQGGRIVAAERVPAGASGSEDAGWLRSELYAGRTPVAALQWSPAGPLLAFVTGGRLWVCNPTGPTLRELAIPGRVGPLNHKPALAWAPDGSVIAVAFEEDKRWDLAVVEASGGVLWRSYTEDLEFPFAWVRGDRLLFARAPITHTLREWYVLDLPVGAPPRLLHSEHEPEGLGQSFAPQPLPDGRGAVMVLRHEGWWHLYLLDTDSGDLRALTDGACEDVGHAMDLPRVSPDGREVVFSTNRENLGMRHLYAAEVGTGATRALVGAPGTSVEPAWSPTGDWVAFRHSNVHHAPELWVVARDGSGLRRLTRSMSDGVDQDGLALPQFVETPGAKGWKIPGYLLTPTNLEAGRKYPALLYIHGGGMRQMREGFPPLEPYAFFYAVSLWLAERGVVSYMVNYRGGIGYGKEFEQGNSGGLGVLECEDCVLAGEYLRTLPFVDPDRVGTWGLSYGGWLTLASLVRSPKTFALGINIAGIWDFDSWMAWAKEDFRPAYDHFLGRALGRRDESPDVWDGASPRHLVAQMRAPLVNLHGTKDEAVPFDQLDMIVKDCLEHGKRYEAHYYPDESHFFTNRATWKDALLRIEDALRAHLGYAPEAE